jgi:7-cyano-7-deazaguanine synthase
MMGLKEESEKDKLEKARLERLQRDIDAWPVRYKDAEIHVMPIPSDLSLQDPWFSRIYNLSKDNQVVLALSGGIDSTTLLYWLHSKGCKIICVSFAYGQKHMIELEHAADIVTDATEKGIDVTGYLIVDMSKFGKFVSSSLTRAGQPVPDGHYEAEVMRQTVVPARNVMFLTILAGIAETRGIQNIAFAAHAGDHFIYPDCRPAFIQSMEKTLQFALDRPEFRIIDPFMHSTKANIVTLGYQLGVPFSLTYSCYKGKEKHCGTCGTCVERKEAFQLAEVIDPTEYEE